MRNYDYLNPEHAVAEVVRADAEAIVKQEEIDWLVALVREFRHYDDDGCPLCHHRAALISENGMIELRHAPDCNLAKFEKRYPYA